MKDILTKGTAEGVGIYALCTTDLVQEAAIRHHTSHLASAALGRAMNGALLLAATMKDNERIALRLKGDGPIGEVVADAEGTHVRGYVGDPDVFLLDEPTRGIDVGAKYEIYQLILDLANRGKTVLMVSSEMPELLGVCDRILVMSGGQLAGEVDAKTATQEDIMRLAAKYV